METTLQWLDNWTDKIEALDAACRSVDLQASGQYAELSDKSEEEVEKLQDENRANMEQHFARMAALLEDERERLRQAYSREIESKRDLFVRLQKSKEMLATLINAEESITNKELYYRYGMKGKRRENVTLDRILYEEVDFTAGAYEVNQVLAPGSTADAAEVCEKFYGLCRRSEALLCEEIDSLREQVGANIEQIHAAYVDPAGGMGMADAWAESMVSLSGYADEMFKRLEHVRKSTGYATSRVHADTKVKKQEKMEEFLQECPTAEAEEVYGKIALWEPEEDALQQKGIPEVITLGAIGYRVEDFGWLQETEDFLKINYNLLVGETEMLIPYVPNLQEEAGLLFRYDGDLAARAAKDASALIYRWLHLLPAETVRFTLYDPVALGDSFSAFSGLIAPKGVVTGKIWTDAVDLEDRLNLLIRHISNVIQNRLQDTYEDLGAYNKAHPEAPEAYRILVLKDYPFGLTNHALEMLSQVLRQGPKCGVYTYIYQSEEQYNRVKDRFGPSLSAVEEKMRCMDAQAEGLAVMKDGLRPVYFAGPNLPDKETIQTVVRSLKTKMEEGA